MWVLVCFLFATFSLGPNRVGSAWQKTAWLCCHCHFKECSFGWTHMQAQCNKVPVNISHHSPFSNSSDAGAGAGIKPTLSLSSYHKFLPCILPQSSHCGPSLSDICTLIYFPLAIFWTRWKPCILFGDITLQAYRQGNQWLPYVGMSESEITLRDQSTLGPVGLLWPTSDLARGSQKKGVGSAQKKLVKMRTMCWLELVWAKPTQVEKGHNYSPNDSFTVQVCMSFIRQ